MGCCCSKTDEWRDSDSDSESISDIDSDISSLSDILHYSGWSTKTVEHRQHTTAGTQQAWLDAELKGDSRCKEEPEVIRNPTRVGPTLESDPCVALDRLSTGGEENTPDGSNSFYSIRPIDADDLEQEQNQWATDEPGPSTVLQTELLTPPPETDTGLFQTLPPGPDPDLFPTPPPGPDPDLFPTPPPGPVSGLFSTPPELSLPSEVDVRVTTISSPDTVSSHHTDVTTSSLNNPGKLYGPETHRRSPKSHFEWQENAELKRSWLPANSRIRKIPSREEGDDPSVSICFYSAPEDLAPPRPERQDVATQTLPPGACGDAPTPSKMESVCHEQHVMAEGGNSGDETKGMVWSKGTPQAEFPQMGRGVDIPGPVSELQPSKAPRDCPQPKTLPGLSAKPPRLQRRGRVSMGRRYQQREADKTKELDAERKPSPLPEIGEANFPSLSAVNVSTATVPATENKSCAEGNWPHWKADSSTSSQKVGEP
ncbi:uncharacterized protein C6orf132 homolog isoform X2 [Takifugu rubripes]|uniref:uncharacterized protein C6orf132 homolog isoform X2 n=1 Tax=Takifugu rubripes TaxID=31033 RepID=UPI001145B225|nr:uncharacterized protein C6orf132 homolog isoform X2 [Takifugu rubripes]